MEELASSSTFVPQLIELPSCPFGAFDTIQPSRAPGSGQTIVMEPGQTVYARLRETVLIPSGEEGKVRLYGGSLGHLLSSAESRDFGSKHGTTGRINVLYGSRLEFESGANFPGHVVVSGRPRLRKKQGLMACQSSACGEVVLHAGSVAHLMESLTLKEGAHVELRPGFNDWEFILPFGTKAVFHCDSLGQCGPGSIGFALNGSCVLYHEDTIVLAEPGAVLTKATVPLPSHHRVDARASGIGLELQLGNVNYVLGPGVYYVAKLLLRGDPTPTTVGPTFNEAVVCPWRTTVLFTPDHSPMSSRRRKQNRPRVATDHPPAIERTDTLVPVRTEAVLLPDNPEMMGSPLQPAAVDEAIRDVYQEDPRVVAPATPPAARTPEGGNSAISEVPPQAFRSPVEGSPITLFVPANGANFKDAGASEPVCWGILIRLPNASSLTSSLLTDSSQPVQAMIGFLPAKPEETI